MAKLLGGDIYYFNWESLIFFETSKGLGVALYVETKNLIARKFVFGLIYTSEALKTKTFYLHQEKKHLKLHFFLCSLMNGVFI